MLAPTTYDQNQVTYYEVSRPSKNQPVILTQAMIDNQKNFQDDCTMAMIEIHETNLAIQSNLCNIVENAKRSEEKASEDRLKYLQQQKELSERKMEQERVLREQEIRSDKIKHEENNRMREKWMNQQEAIRLAELKSQESYRSEQQQLREERLKREDQQRKDDNERWDADRKERVEKQRLLDEAYKRDQENLAEEKKAREKEIQEAKIALKIEEEKRRFKHELDMAQLKEQDKWNFSFAVLVLLFGLFIFLYYK